MNTNNSQNFLSKIILRELYLNKINKKINKSINLINKLDYDLISTFNLKGGSNATELLSKIKIFNTELNEISKLRVGLSGRLKELISKLPADAITIESVRKQLDELTTEKTVLDGRIQQIQKETTDIIDVVRKIDTSNMLTILSAISHLGTFGYQDLRQLFFEYAKLKYPLKDDIKNNIMRWFIDYLEKYQDDANNKTNFLKLLYYRLSFNTVPENKQEFDKYLESNRDTYEYLNYNIYNTGSDSINIEDIKKQIK